LVRPLDALRATDAVRAREVLIVGVICGRLAVAAHLHAPELTSQPVPVSCSEVVDVGDPVKWPLGGAIPGLAMPAEAAVRLVFFIEELPAVSDPAVGFRTDDVVMNRPLWLPTGHNPSPFCDFVI